MERGFNQPSFRIGGRDNENRYKMTNQNIGLVVDGGELQIIFHL